MARFSRLVKPASPDLLHLRVLRTARLSEHWMRVTLGEGEIDRFVPLGYDQWFRLFLPVGGDEGLDRIPAKANKLLGYLKYLRIPDGVRPVMRNYTVRAYRAATAGAGAEIDVDFVLHGTGPDAGPASRWAASARPGDSVVIIDEGLGFDPERGVDRVILAADETGLPAVSGVCASLPVNATGVALIEVPSEADALAFEAPAGVEVRWLVRDAQTRPGALALAALEEIPLHAEGTHAFIVGEQSLPTSARRALVARGLDKASISFIGYWRLGAARSASQSAKVDA
ncbi:siderophore-interacting protein [Microbacterium sp. RG1]|uniref:siderophore-interacting protein n=1 Tax=Microbacterium sp. RG1 TaxID=2489212 RepID=UPI0010CA2BC3|nr:siderophore-interacting protein [Microbacterium sp. RG1]QCQ17299.1 siderophore-interacting protein [Microbacterium sp. RG1]